MAGTGVDFFRTLAWGVTGWLALSTGGIMWFFMQPGEKGLAAIGAPLIAWTAGHLPGGAVLLLYGCVQGVRRRLDIRTFVWAALVYFSPFLITLALSRMALRAAPTYAAHSDFGAGIVSVAGPLMAILYIAGLINGYAHRKEPFYSVVRKTVTPQIIGALGLLVWVFVSISGSADFQSRYLVDLSVDKASSTAKEVVLEVTFRLEKDADYEYKALYVEHGGFGQTVRGEIQWIRENGVPKTAGRHSARIVFKDVRPYKENVTSRELFFDVYAKNKHVVDPDILYADLVRTFKIPLRFTE